MQAGSQALASTSFADLTHRSVTAFASMLDRILVTALRA